MKGIKDNRRSKRELTDIHIQLLRFIFNHIKRHGYAPVYRSIQSKMRMSSTSVVRYRLETLEIFGYLLRDPGLARAMKITPIGRKALTVSAKPAMPIY